MGIFRLGRNTFYWAFIILLRVLLNVSDTALADVAPSPPPLGSNPWGENPNTKVQMVSETVIFDMAASSPNPFGQASVTATFNLHNQGDVDEKMVARFPLGFIMDGDCYYSSYPSINDLAV